MMFYSVQQAACWVTISLKDLALFNALVSMVIVSHVNQFGFDFFKFRFALIDDVKVDDRFSGQFGYRGATDVLDSIIQSDQALADFKF